jgi:hypothetical protein
MTSAQLSLFDTSPAVGTLYKAGDWVKLRKKPSGDAAWVKRGEMFRIDTVHPENGSLRFWNPHVNEWGFLYPDEVSLAPSPVDSVSESIAPGVDTESNRLPDDSVSKAIAPGVDTESNRLPVDSVSAACKAISTYRPRGTARGGEYFRFSYRDGCKMKHVHIRGGNTDSAIAQAKVEEVRSALAAGTPAAEILEMLRPKNP